MTLPKPRLVKLLRMADERGFLCSLENNHHIPFEVKRWFWVYGVPPLHSRGNHAHKQCHQMLVCISGQCRVHWDNGQETQEYLLDSPETGLYIPPMVWASQREFSANAVLLVLASHAFDLQDYIEDYQAFLPKI